MGIEQIVRDYKTAVVGTTLEGAALKGFHYPVNQFTIAAIPPLPAKKVFGGGKAYFESKPAAVRTGSGAAKSVHVEALSFAATFAPSQLPKGKSEQTFLDDITAHFAANGVTVLQRDSEKRPHKGHYVVDAEFRIPLQGTQNSSDPFHVAHRLATALQGVANSMVAQNG